MLCRETGKSKGIALVQFVNADEAVAAHAAEDAKPFQGRLLHILPGHRPPSSRVAAEAEVRSPDPLALRGVSCECECLPQPTNRKCYFVQIVARILYRVIVIRISCPTLTASSVASVPADPQMSLGASYEMKREEVLVLPDSADVCCCNACMTALPRRSECLLGSDRRRSRESALDAKHALIASVAFKRSGLSTR